MGRGPAHIERIKRNGIEEKVHEVVIPKFRNELKDARAVPSGGGIA